jgi:hypothetical protein
MRVNVNPRVPDDIRKHLETDLGMHSKEVRDYLFRLVGRTIQLEDHDIGTIQFTEVLPMTVGEPVEVGSTEGTLTIRRVRCLVMVRYEMEAFVREFLPGGSRAAKATDEVGSVKGDPVPAVKG